MAATASVRRRALERNADRTGRFSGSRTRRRRWTRRRPLPSHAQVPADGPSSPTRACTSSLRLRRHRHLGTAGSRRQEEGVDPRRRQPVLAGVAQQRAFERDERRVGLVFPCRSCHESIVVAFSCKARGICKSCDGRRMTEVAAHWVDEVIPAVPVRQFVLTFPWDLRYLLAWNAPLRTAVLTAFQRALEAHYRKQALADGGEDPKYAAVSVVQRFDGAVRLCLHVHVLCADGAFCKAPSGRKFLPAPLP